MIQLPTNTRSLIDQWQWLLIAILLAAFLMPSLFVLQENFWHLKTLMRQKELRKELLQANGLLFYLKPIVWIFLLVLWVSLILKLFVVP